METIKIDPFKLIGISVRTRNDKDSIKSIEKLWAKFMNENLLDKIPNKIDTTAFAIYTNYEGDHTQYYDLVIGCSVSSLNDVPEGMVALEFDGGTYVKFVSKGNLNDGVVYKTWQEIWNTDLDRAYTADFEIYGKKAQDPTNAEVDILIAINK